MAAREPLEPPPERPEYGAPVERPSYTVVEHRSNGGLWALLIVLVLVAIALGTLYYTGAFNGRPLYSETNKVNIKVHTPASPAGGNGGGGSSQSGP